MWSIENASYASSNRTVRDDSSQHGPYPTWQPRPTRPARDTAAVKPKARKFGGAFQKISVPSTTTALHRQQIEWNKDGTPVRPDLEAFSHMLEKNPKEIPGVCSEQLYDDLDPTIQRRAWSAETIGGDRVRAAISVRRPLTQQQRVHQRKLKNQLFVSTEEEIRQSAELVLGLLDQWIDVHQLRMLDLFRRNDINTSNRGRVADSSDNVLVVSEMTTALTAQLNVTHEDVRRLFKFMDRDGNNEIDIGELEEALRRNRRRVILDHAKSRNTRAATKRLEAALNRPLPADLDACLALPPGVDTIWLAIDPEHRPDPDRLLTDARRHATTPAMELAQCVAARLTMKFATGVVDLAATAAANRSPLQRHEVAALGQALHRRGVSLVGVNGDEDPAGSWHGGR